jgi:hypothetical protein
MPGSDVPRSGSRKVKMAGDKADVDILWEEAEDTAKMQADEENRGLLRRQSDFWEAARWVAEAFARLSFVERVALFGSVASRLGKEVPRFRKFRRAGVALWHECKDVDLAVWVSRLDSLRSLQKARGRALARLLERRNIGVAHHQVDIFLMESGTDRYLGRLCNFKVCPKGKPECRVPGCGASLFLQQHKNFVFDPAGLAPEKSIMLYDRADPAGTAIPRDVVEDIPS